MIWDKSPSTNAVGYTLHWMFPDGTGKLAYDVGNSTSARVDNLNPGQTYQFYATAYDSKRMESPPSNTLTYLVPALNPSRFIRADSATKGNWKGVYGRDGYWIATLPSARPTYATIAPNASQWAWTTNSTNPAYLRYPGTATNGLATCWYSSSQMTIDVSVADAKVHRVSMYFLDASSSGRIQRVDVVNRSTGAVVDSRTVANFAQGIYLTWEITGNVTFRITPSNVNGVVSGIFFDPVPISAG